jgi:NDP-sugar pyrophosphorylase family protein
MTNQAIILVDPQKDKDLLFHQINGKVFLHYQLRYLADNLFKKIIIVENTQAPQLKTFFGSDYLDMEIIYLNRDEKSSESAVLLRALDVVDDIYAFVFDAHHYFRLNLGKADDFRRMRDSKMLHIGKKVEKTPSGFLPHLELDEKGRILQIKPPIDHQEADTLFSSSWLISKSFFIKQFQSTEGSLLEILKTRYKEHREYCLACRQYFLTISSTKDLETADYEFTQYHY